MTTGNPLSVPRRDPTAQKAIRRADRQRPRRKVEYDPRETAMSTAFLDALTRPMRLGVPAMLIVRAFADVTHGQHA